MVKRSHGCWLWTGSTAGKGYGTFGVKKNGKHRMTGAHRFSYELHVGRIPKGLHVLHRCDTKRCVRPDHLFVGTNGDNIKDRIKKGRNRQGEEHHFSRLTEADIRRVRLLRKEGFFQRQIAEKVGCSQPTVGRILQGKIWKHVK